MLKQDTDVVVIGAGIAGISLAATLAPSLRVTVCEMESQPAYHATGRSAAYYAPAYGNESVRALTRLGDGFFRHPDEEFTDIPLLRPRGAVFIGGQDQGGSLRQMQDEDDSLVAVDADWLKSTVPILNTDHITQGLHDEGGGDLDVHAIMQGYLKQLRLHGGELLTASRVDQIKSGDVWQIRTDKGGIYAPVLVNAAGAWADQIALMAGVLPTGIVPKRRTALLIDPPADLVIDDWPLTIDVDEQLYFKPDAGQLLISPADETPSEPTDASAEEYDVALAIDRFMSTTSMSVKKINHRWAGLRSFAPDKTFVVGFEPDQSGFFWLAGQGGYGVQSAPGVSQLAAHLITGNTLPADYQSAANYRDAVDPARFR